MSVEAESTAPEAAPARLYGYAVFHLNLCFSSIEEEARPDVVARAYWPLLRLAREQDLPLGIEATGYTLECVAAIDPAWIAELKALIAEGRVEFIGSGYAQLISPLVPARVTEANLHHGNEIYRRLLDARPLLALVNEQAYAGGLPGLYRDAGYEALLMDWDNSATFNRHWPADGRYRPVTARGNDGAEIAILWTNTIAFQKLQRLAHGDIELRDYLSYVRGHAGETPRALALYGNDAECFDFRPGRFKTEDRLHADGEWARIARAFAALKEMDGLAFVKPSQALTMVDRAPGDAALRLETAENPIPVKKQPKYNVSRWAVTGRDDLDINTLCARVHAHLADAKTPLEAPAWRELCYLWSSDFRTHITPKRWSAFRSRLDAFAAALPPPAPKPEAPEILWKNSTAIRAGRWLDIETQNLTARLDTRRGLAIDRLTAGGDTMPLLGGLPHGHFDDIALSADWYTGDTVYEAPGLPKVTDLERCEPQTRIDAETGDVVVSAEIATPLGPIAKTLRLHAYAPKVTFDLTFRWSEWGRGALRLGHFTLRPEAFDWNCLVLRTHNGGRAPDEFALAGKTIEHGAPVSFLVSASSALGLTEGWAEIGDGKRTLRVTVDRTASALVGLLTHKRVGGSLFCQLMLSAMEMDDTRVPAPGPVERRMRFAVEAVR